VYFICIFVDQDPFSDWSLSFGPPYLTSYRWQVAPAEIEAVLLKHPEIADAAVIGVSQKDQQDDTGAMTETVRAFVVRRKGVTTSNLTAEEVYGFARKQLASYKALDGGVIFVEDIPRTPSGKIQRFKLVQMNSYREIVSTLLLKIDGGNGGNNGVTADVGSVGLGRRSSMSMHMSVGMGMSVVRGSGAPTTTTAAPQIEMKS
jgi:hypothetical protein